MPRWTPRLCDCVRRAPRPWRALTVLSWLCLVMTAAWPLAADAQDSAGIETIEVVGRPSRPDDRTSANPVTIIDAETIAASGATTIDQLLNMIPAMGFQGVNGNQNDGGYGAAFADLRNLNFNRTLVLVNGRRFVLTGIKTDEAVDLNAIPVSLIDHVEILRDGSEPEYGADAIAGAINIVLKRLVDGATATAIGGVSGHGDGGTGNLSGTWGHDFDNGDFTLNLDWARRDALPQSDRSWARDPITAASYGPNGRIILDRGDTATLGGHATGAGGLDALVTGPGQSRPFNPMRDGYDFSAAHYLQGGLDRAGLTALGHYDVTSDVSAFTEFLYSHRKSTTELPPQDLGVAGTQKYPAGFIVPAGNPYNVFGQDITLARVLNEAGAQLTTTTVDTVRLVVGLDGALPGADEDTHWTLSYNHGVTGETYSTRNAVNLAKALATVSGDPTLCQASQGCVAADYFGSGSLSPAAVDYIRYTDVATSGYGENIVLLGLSRTIATLPAGPWDVTISGEHRAEHGFTTPSPVTLAGDQAGSDAAPTKGGYASREAAIDFDLPLLRDARMAKSLTAEASGRYASYDRFGAFPVWKTSLSWSPIDDVRFRADIATGRRVPAITEAFGGATANFMTVQDPCDGRNGLLSNPVVAANCRAIGLASGFTQSSPLIAVANGGNPNLRPEQSRNLSAGIVLTPRALPGLTLSVDYYKIDIEHAIDSYADTDPNFIPDACFASVRLSSPLCRNIIRAPSGPSAGQINLISAPDENIGAIKTDGLDVTVNDKFPLWHFGQLSLDWQNTLLFDYLVKETGESGFTQYAGTFPGLVAVGSYARFKSLLSATVEHDAWSFGCATRYIGGAKVLGANPATTLYATAPGVFYVDMDATWRLGPATITAGIENLADRKPPLLVDGVSNTNLNTYDVVGRFFYLKTTVVF